MTTVVLFTTNNARVLHNPPGIEAYRKMPNALINPDFAPVMGLPPHYWKAVDGKLAAKTPAECAATDAHHIEHGVDNIGDSTLPPVCVPMNPVLRKVLELAAAFVAGAALAAGLLKVL